MDMNCQLELVNKCINNTRKLNEDTDRMEGIRLVRKVRDWILNGRRYFARPKMWKDMVRHED
jgi:hypothetical protein